MVSTARIEQAVLLLREKLDRLQSTKQGAVQSGMATSGSAEGALDPLRKMVKQGELRRPDLRKALVRNLLAGTFGPMLATSLELQSVADEVTRILEENPEGLVLLDRALDELE